MEVSRMSQHEPGDRSGPDLQKTESQAAHVQCERCGSAADDQQRYCVACGAHLRHAYDPAARYFSEVGSSARTLLAGSRPQRKASRSRGVALAIVLALIPVAAAVGVLAGRSSNNEDAQLIRALARRPAAVTVAGAESQPRQVAARHSRRVRAAHHQRARAAHPSKAVSTTRYGSTAQITGFKATKSERHQGASDTQRVQKSTGKRYVNTQNNLPAQVVVP